MYNIYTFILILGLASCGQNKINDNESEAIIEKAIEAHGSNLLKNSIVEFDFRKYHIRVSIENGNYKYERSYVDSTGTIAEELTNHDFKRWVNGEYQELSEKESSKHANSLNSQVYFALLPLPLKDAAVNSTYLGKSEIGNKIYDKIKITFDKEGGGKDYEDEFMYWFHEDEGTMDYLAYEFHVDKGGIRFREAFNRRSINGVLFADFNNYKEIDEELPLETYDSLFNEDKLKLLSQIELKNLQVSLNSKK